MTAVIVLNVVFSVFVVASILALLGGAIVKDKAWASTLPAPRRDRPRRTRRDVPVATRPASSLA